MIEDEELRSLFQTESEEYLQSLDDGLLRLEATPRDAVALEEVFRAAHSLKGTARMLGVGGIETIAHHLEDELGHAKAGRTVLSPTVIDRMYVGVDAIRKLVGEAVSGKQAGINVERVLEGLKAKEAAPDPRAEETSAVTPPPSRQETVPPERFERRTADKVSIPEIAVHSLGASPAQSEGPPVTLGLHLTRSTDAITSIPAGTPSPDAVPIVGQDEDESQAQLASTGRNDSRIQTMRVPPAKLDALLTLASELTVTTNRVTRGLAFFAEMGELWEEWNRELSGKSSMASFSQRNTHSGPDANLHRLADFHREEQLRLARLRALWNHLKETIYEDVTRLGFVAEHLDEGIRNVRLLPLSTIFNLFPRLVRDLARSQDKEVQFVIEGSETTADKRILEELKDPLMHMIRNGIDHGIESPEERLANGKPRGATLYLRARQTATNVIVELQDDGRGLNVDSIRATALKRRLHSEEELNEMSREQLELLIFAPGFSTSPMVTDVSGRGVGLDVVRTNIEKLKGSIQVNSKPGLGCTFVLLFPLTLATMRVLLVEVDGRSYGLPVEFVQGAIYVLSQQFFTIEGRQTIVLEEEAVEVVRLSQLLELPISAPSLTQRRNSANSGAQKSSNSHVCVILATGTEKLAVVVDALVDEQEVMLKPLGPLLKRVRNVSGVTILGAGEVCMILNTHDLIKSAHRSRAVSIRSLAGPGEEEDERRKVVLLAEDSITTRTQEKRILESAGYEVVTAVDGADAFAKLGTRIFDAVVSDVEMPNLDGISLVAKIREDDKHKELPIILVTSLATDADKRRGIEVGANAYITKGTFEQKALLDTLGRLI